jgi:prepilin-type N-terminal cleavage/methylation domain-containing protein
MKKRGFTLIELLVVIAIIAMLLAILMPALNKVKKIAQRVVCGTNLKGLGTAQTVYANDYDDEYAVQGQGAAHTWAANEKTTSWQDPSKPWKTAGNITVGASLYLLVREADVSPKSFVCPSSDQQPFSGKNTGNYDIVQLWDFGAFDGPQAEGPAACVSYSYHQPYAAGQSGAVSTGSKGRYAADGTRSAAFAMMADKNPYQDTKLVNTGTADQANYVDNVRPVGAGTVPADGTYDSIEKWRILIANAQAHSREGQNILFGDGHSSYETRSDIGVKNDCIYTRWESTASTPESVRRRGFKPTSRDTDFAPLGTDDSVLVNDDVKLE